PYLKLHSPLMHHDVAGHLTVCAWFGHLLNLLDFGISYIFVFICAADAAYRSPDAARLYP
ncbi:MAG TPA: hypothetical protein VK638_03900, partial [Edaphobacter sp.]|nr:hypothetical protein [Edaphobacter sp.]